jgi:predicted kinase
MIINLRGPSGAGKSWVCRQLLAKYPATEEVIWRDQVTVEGYRLSSPRPTFLVGEYRPRRIAAGGCDAFSHLPDPMGIIEDIVLRHHKAGEVVIFEGIRVSAGHSRWLELAEAYPVDWRVIFLDTSLQQCLDNQYTRRAAAGTNRHDQTLYKTTEDHLTRMRRQKAHFTDTAIGVYSMEAEQAVNVITSWLGE